MPGSKRRALKKLLSPNSGPSDPSTSTSPSSSPPQSNSTSSNSLSQMISPPSGQALPPPAVPLSQGEIQEDLVLENMHQNEKAIGHSTSPASLRTTEVAAPATVAVAAAPPPPPSGGGMYGNAFGSGNNGNGGGKKKKSSRQKFEERQARKTQALLESAPPDDPNWNAQLEKERLEEIQMIGDACTVLGREIYEIAPDGHCMYSAIADQLAEIGVLPSKDAENYSVTRNAAAKFMLSHPDDFMPFLPSITGEDSAGATDDGVMTEAGFKKYCQLVAETGEWGGEPEIQALSRQYNVPIHVFQRGPPTVVSHGGSADAFGGAMTPEQSLAAGDKVVRISYHKRMYGLGEHYNSLRKV
ncbi:OTU domain-containing protein 6B [Kwoniella mangroviensis CBS 10435]|uniref:OTU domain-containing protein 6B n=1 Tax=Kwoniella mangroviensis CBS 10435 TaxID=1331196 RepID=A0A1B9IWR3_9TREE|nr:OTU domain-containing protein 6B [Kwoniella mangroviensis CBS 10435]